MKKEIKLGLFLIIVFVVFAYFIIKTESCSDFFSKGKRYPLHRQVHHLGRDVHVGSGPPGRRQDRHRR